MAFDPERQAARQERRADRRAARQERRANRRGLLTPELPDLPPPPTPVRTPEIGTLITNPQRRGGRSSLISSGLNTPAANTSPRTLITG